MDRQRDECSKIVADRGWDLIGEYVDNSISASSRETRRPGYEQMVADFKAGKFEAIVCWDLDRLTRQPRQLEDWIDAAEGQGLVLVTANGEADLSAESGRLFARIKAAVARAEIEHKGARQKAAHRQRVARGGFWTASLPFGYVKGQREPDPAIAKLLREAADTILSGGTIASIVRKWDAAGVRNTKYADARPYTAPAIRKMLLNPHYAGRLIYLGEDRGPGDWEPVFDMSTHLALVETLKDPKRTLGKVSTGPKASTLLSGLFTCGRCGSGGRAGTRKGVKQEDGSMGPRRKTYFCSNCEQFILREPFETQVVTRVVARLSQPDYLAGLVSSHEDIDADAIQLQLDELSERERVLGAAFGRGTISEQVLEAGMTEIVAEKEVLSEQLRSAAPSGTALDVIDVGTAEVAEQFLGLDLDRQRLVIKSACNQITLWPRSSGRERVEVDLK